MNISYNSYIKNIENENYLTCIEHRKKFNLPINIDLENIDCECECIAHKTCPIFNNMSPIFNIKS